MSFARAPVDPHRTPNSLEAPLLDDGVRDTIATEKTVLMKTVAPVGTTEPGVPCSIDFRPAFLSCDTFNGELRMCVSVLAQNRAGVNRISVVQRYAKGFRRLDSLKNIHVVGQRCLAVRLSKPIVPARPREALSWE